MNSIKCHKQSSHSASFAVYHLACRYCWSKAVLCIVWWCSKNRGRRIFGFCHQSNCHCYYNLPSAFIWNPAWGLICCSSFVYSMHIFRAFICFGFRTPRSWLWIWSFRLKARQGDGQTPQSKNKKDNNKNKIQNQNVKTNSSIDSMYKAILHHRLKRIQFIHVMDLCLSRNASAG